jgi:transcriptional regulator with XRE-family HTH domain
MTTEPAKPEIYQEDQIWLDAQIRELTFGRCLKAHRLCEEWTQEQSAEKLGISKQMYNAYEKDRKLPTPKKAYEMAKALGMVPEMLVLTVLNDQLRKDKLPFQVSVAS